jgi:YesN/AraC family two-component response regulator
VVILAFDHVVASTVTATMDVFYPIGYEDPGFFRKVFVRHTGLRPREYRSKFTVVI